MEKYQKTRDVTCQDSPAAQSVASSSDNDATSGTGEQTSSVETQKEKKKKKKRKREKERDETLSQDETTAVINDENSDMDTKVVADISVTEEGVSDEPRRKKKKSKKDKKDGSLDPASGECGSLVDGSDVGPGTDSTERLGECLANGNSSAELEGGQSRECEEGNASSKKAKRRRKRDLENESVVTEKAECDSFGGENETIKKKKKKRKPKGE